MVSPCRVTAEVGAFHRSSQVDNGSTRMTSRFMFSPMAARSRFKRQPTAFVAQDVSTAVEVLGFLQRGALMECRPCARKSPPVGASGLRSLFSRHDGALPIQRSQYIRGNPVSA